MAARGRLGTHTLRLSSGSVWWGWWLALADSVFGYGHSVPRSIRYNDPRSSAPHWFAKPKSASTRFSGQQLLPFLSLNVFVNRPAIVFTDFPSITALSPLTIWTVVEMTNYGRWWSVRMTASVALVGLCVFGLRSVASRVGKSSAFPARSLLLAIILAVLGSVVLISISLTGHARAVSRWPVLAVGSDWAHLAATTIWIGGLAFLWITVSIEEGKNEEGTEFLLAVATRFSLIARICVAVLVITGIYAAWLHMPNWRSFVSTDYGRVLSIKLLIIVPLFLIGLINWRCVLPALGRYFIGAPGRTHADPQIGGPH